MEFLDIRTLKVTRLVNRDFKYGADRLIWRSFYICVHASAQHVASYSRKLRRIEEGCRIASTGIRAKRIRKFTLTFSQHQYVDYSAAEFEQSIMAMVFATLRLLTGLRQLKLDLERASWRARIDGVMLDLIRGPFPFQLEHFALTKPSCDEMEFLPEFLLPQKSITSLFINWAGPPYRTISAPPRPRPLHILDWGEWHLVRNRPITHLFAALTDANEVFDLFGSLSQSSATLQLLWFRAPALPASEAFFQFAADPIATRVVSNLRYLVLETLQGGNIRVLSLFSNLEELVMDLRPTWDPLDPNGIESDFFKSSKSCPHLRKAVLFLYDGLSGFVIRFYRRLGAQEDWELMREDRGLRGRDEREPLIRRRHRFPAMVYVFCETVWAFIHSRRLNAYSLIDLMWVEKCLEEVLWKLQQSDRPHVAY